MNHIQGAGNEIHIVVELLDKSFERFTNKQELECRDLKRELWQYIGDIVTDSNIPAKISLDIHFSEEREGLDILTAYRILINGIKCRLELPTIISADSRAHDVAAAVAISIYQNRELLINTPLAGYILESWLAEAGVVYRPGLAIENFESFLMHFVYRGFAINRGKAITLNYYRKNQGKWNAEAYFEKAVSELNSTNIGLFFSNKDEKLPSLTDIGSIDELFDQLQSIFYYELGLIIPKFNIDKDGQLEENTFRIQLNDLRLPPISAESTDFISQSLEAEIKRHAGNFLNTETVKFRMDLLREQFPTLIQAAEKRFNLITLVQIFRELFDEGISIRDLPRVLEGLLAIKETEAVDFNDSIIFLPGTGHVYPVSQPKSMEDLDVIDYSNFVRTHLKQSIAYKCARGYNSLSYYSIAPEIEMELRNTNQYRLRDTALDGLRKKIFDKVKRSRSSTQIIVTALDVRKKMKIFIGKELPWLTVLSYLEIPPYIDSRYLGQIS